MLKVTDAWPTTVPAVLEVKVTVHSPLTVPMLPQVSVTLTAEPVSVTSGMVVSGAGPKPSTPSPPSSAARPSSCSTSTVNVWFSPMLLVSSGVIPILASTNCFRASPEFCPVASVATWIVTPSRSMSASAWPVTVPAVSDVKLTVQLPLTVPVVAQLSTTSVTAAPFASVSVTSTIVPSGAGSTRCRSSWRRRP